MQALDPSGERAYSLRGRHHALSHIDLPPWLPCEIVETLVRQYQEYLCRELLQLQARKVSHYESDSDSDFDSRDC